MTKVDRFIQLVRGYLLTHNFEFNEADNEITIRGLQLNGYGGYYGNHQNLVINFETGDVYAKEEYSRAEVQVLLKLSKRHIEKILADSLIISTNENILDGVISYFESQENPVQIARVRIATEQYVEQPLEEEDEN